MIRYKNNPILTRKDIPDIAPYLIDATSVFNPGAVTYDGRFVLLTRVQNRGRETFTIVAFSDNGIDFQVEKKIVTYMGLEDIGDTIYHCYDPRITFIDGIYYIMMALDMDSGCRLGLARTEDFQSFTFLGIVSNEDNRNGVLFPEKINGKYARLDRPNLVQLEGGPRSGGSICLSTSDDLLHWEHQGTVISGQRCYWDERIGAGPPPIKTNAGWLQIYHGIADHFGSTSIYQAGVLLLDLDNPRKVLSRGKYNILEPRELYELTGQVPNVVFPSGAVVHDVDENGFARNSSKVNIYYGAADTCIGLAFTTINDLITAASN